MAFQLGQAPEALRVILVGAADFVSSLRRKDNTPWIAPGQPEPELYLSFVTRDPQTPWYATFDGPTATWNVDQVEVDAMILAAPRGVRLWYVEGELRLLWAQGDVDIRRS